MRKRILSMLLCIMMCIIILPMMIFANVINNKVYAVLDDDGTMTIGSWDTKPEGAYEFSILKSVNSPDEIPWYNKRKEIKKVEFDSSVKNYKPTSLNYWFYDCNALLTVANTEYLDTSSVKDMSDMFYGCSSLTTLDVSEWNTSSVTDMSAMFYDCSSLTTLDVSKWNTSSVTNMACMFYTCYSLTTLDVSEWNTSSVTDMSAMFYDCNSLTTLDVSKWDTSAVTDMSTMFWICPSLTTLDVSEWDTSSATDMSDMFYYCSSLTTLDVSEWDTSSVTDMSDMFYDCVALETLDVSKWDTSAVTNMACMFYGCHSLTTLDVSEWNTSSVKDMGDMFNGCSSLTTLDVSKWNTSSVTNMACMFYTCYSLTTLDVSEWNTSSVTDMSEMFYDCFSLTTLDVSKWDTSAVTDMSTMFCICSSLTTLDVSKWDTSAVTDMSTMFWICPSLTTLDVSEWDTSSVTDMSDMFYRCSSLTTLDVSEWNTSSVTDMSDMFYDCSSLTTLDVSNWDTSSVTDMSDMFFYCSSLTTLDVSEWDTSSVTDMSAMFYDCVALETLDVSKWDTSAVTNMACMFYGCHSLTTLDVSNWDTSSVTVMDSMFRACYSLTTLDVSEWDTSSVTDMSYMFYNCVALETLDVSKWDTSAVTNMAWMFSGCSSLTTLDVSNWDTSSVTDMSDMFYDCFSLTTLDVSEWDTSSVTDMSDMFYDCVALETLDVSKWDTSAVTNMTCMFIGCSSLTTLDVSNWDTSSVTVMDSMFRSCSSLTTLDLSGWDMSSIGYDSENYITGISSMFLDCSKLKTIYVSNNLTLSDSATENSYDVFKNCTSLTGGAGTVYKDIYNTYDVNDTNYAHIDGGTSNPGYFTFGYHITFDIGEGTTGEAPESVFVTTGKQIILPSASSLFLKVGYKFIGWSDGTKTYEAGTTFTVGTEVVNFTAVWEKCSNAPDVCNYNVWVNGYRFTTEVPFIVCGKGTAVFNPANNTLTLNNATITNEYFDYENCFGGGIASDGPLTIVLEGKNVIDFTNKAGGGDGIFVSGDLTLTGAGSLDIIGCTTGIYADEGDTNIDMDGDLYINTYWGDFYCIIAECDINISGSGNIELISGANYDCGLEAYGSCNISGSGNLSIKASDWGILTLGGGTNISGDRNITIDSLNSCIFAQYADINITGSGDITLNGMHASGIYVQLETASPTHIYVNTSGKLTINARDYGMYEPHNIIIEGTGDIEINSNVGLAVDTLESLISVAGSGNVVINSAASGISSFGDVKISSNGHVDITSEGSVGIGVGNGMLDVSGNGTLNVTSKADAAIDILNTSEKLVLNGNNREVAFTSAPGFSAVYNSSTQDKFPVTLLNGDRYIITGSPEESSVVYSMEYYIVNFEMNGHGTAPAEQRVVDGNTATKPDEPCADGWTFDGWYVDSLFTTPFDFDSAITSDTELYAKWTCKHADTEIKDVKEATCTADGYTGDTYCKVCGEKLEEGEVIPAGHIWENDFTVDKEPTYTEEGSKSIHCTKCGATKDVTAIPTLTSEPTNTPTPTPTPTPEPTTTPAPELNVGDFVDRCYEVALGRDADEGGYDYWKNQLINGEVCGSQAAFGFIFSTEYANKDTTNEQFVTDMYSMLFGRKPDEAGYNYWLEQLNGETATREQVFAGFANSEEFYNLCNKYGVVSGAYIEGVSNEQQGGVNCFVARLYKVCLNRLPDQGGQAGWVQKLINGELSGSTCAYGFVFSEEFTNMNLDNTDFVKNMYAAFFGREADEEGLNYWVDMLNGGTATREDVFNGFTGSPEFANLCASYGINV